MLAMRLLTMHDQGYVHVQASLRDTVGHAQGGYVRCEVERGKDRTEENNLLGIALSYEGQEAADDLDRSDSVDSQLLLEGL